MTQAPSNQSIPTFSGSSIGFGLPDVGKYASPALGDIDGDGDLDLFIGNQEGNTLFFRNTGSASSPAFSGSSIGFGLPDMGSYANPTFADIDRDGDLDLFIGNGSGDPYFFRNTGSASSPAFSGSSIGFGLPNVDYNASPTFVDIDRDGDLDLFIGTGDGNTLFFRNTGSASSPAFSRSSIGFGLPSVGYNVSPTLADIDGDGDLDLFVGRRDGNTLFFRNTGSASSPAFSGSSIGFGLPDVGSNARPTFADIDRDGDLDLFIGNRDGNTLFFRNAASAGTATPSPKVTGISAGNNNGTYGLGSILSIVVTFSEAVKVSGTPTLALETGTTDRTVTYSSGTGTTTLTFTYTVQAGDTSSDLDVASAAALQLPTGASITNADGTTAADLSLPLGAGTTGSLANSKALVVNGQISPIEPAFSAGSIGFGLPSVSYNSHPAIADIDGDGDQDLFVGNEGGSTFFFLNTGNASSPAFAGSSIGFGLPDVGVYASPAFADIDGDGDLDLFIGNQVGNVLFFRNTGSASSPAFAGPSIGFGIPNVGRSASPTFADIDGDRDLDLFIGNKDGSILFFRNSGSATSPAFSASSIGYGLPDVGKFASPSFVDIDGDGDLDLFVGNGYGDPYFFRNTGSTVSPSFAGSSIGFGLSSGSSRATLASADIDGDGDLDILLGTGIGKLIFFRNTGSAGATSSSPKVTGISANNNNGTYGLGSTLSIIVTFSEAVKVSGSPTLALETGTTDRTATYSSGTGTTTLTFTYTVQAEDTSSDLDVASAAALQLPTGASIKNAEGSTDAILTLPVGSSTMGSLANRKALLIDGTPSLPIPSAIAGIDLDGNSASPNNEGPANAFDGNSQTKYLNNGQAGSGFEFSYLRPTKIGSFVLTTGHLE